MSKSRATAEQLSALATFVAENQKIEHTKFSASFTKKDQKKKWEEIAEKLNTMPGAKKTLAQWKKVNILK